MILFAVLSPGIQWEGGRVRLAPATEEENLGPLMQMVRFIKLGVVQELDIVPEDVSLLIGEGLGEAVKGEKVLWGKAKQLCCILQGSVSDTQGTGVLLT